MNENPISHTFRQKVLPDHIPGYWISTGVQRMPDIRLYRGIQQILDCRICRGTQRIPDIRLYVDIEQM